MSDELIKPKLYGIGHNYQEKRKFPQGLLNCYAPPADSGMHLTDTAKAAYKETAAAPKKGGAGY